MFAETIDAASTPGKLSNWRQPEKNVKTGEGAERKSKNGVYKTA